MATIGGLIAIPVDNCTQLGRRRMKAVFLVLAAMPADSLSVIVRTRAGFPLNRDFAPATRIRSEAGWPWTGSRNGASDFA